LVDGKGGVLSVQRRTATDSYNVFQKDPSKAGQVVVSGPGAGNASSPSGWLSGAQKTTAITGNNVSAYLDADTNNRADRGGSAVADGNFLTSAALTQSPSTTGNMAVAVQNLFYLNNVLHDTLYGHGFNEAAGNFQTNNFGKGGAGSDAVNAEAQDGGGLDNANFATPVDGQKPRMQMYLWNGVGATHELAVSGGATYGAMGATFGPALTSTGVSGAVLLANDGVNTTSDACEVLPAGVKGKLVLADRGTCAFTLKVQNAQSAGATGVIVANNAAGMFAMGGDARLRIPAIMVEQSAGAALKLLAGPSATMRKKAIQPLLIDGDFDSDIVYHEYGHGLSWRMIGDMSGPLAGALGEGASDVLAFLINDDDVVGEYALSNPNGIRRYRYQGYPLTYGQVTGAGVHDDGEIYAGAMWRLRDLYRTTGGFGDNKALMDDFVDGMNYTAPSPAYEDMRNGMLDAINARLGGAGATRCAMVWQAFAQSGIGDGATGTVISATSVAITPSTAARSDCSH
jgi:extracellular elastinolytic metalloproteinase